MAKRTGRPPNPQESETFEVTLPKAAHGYLVHLAKNTMLGASVNDVAALILTNQLTEMARTTAAFLIQCLEAVGAHTVRLDDG